MAIENLKTDAAKTVAGARKLLKSRGFVWAADVGLWWQPNTWPATPDYAVITGSTFPMVSTGSFNDVRDYRDAMRRIEARRKVRK